MNSVLFLVCLMEMSYHLSNFLLCKTLIGNFLDMKGKLNYRGLKDRSFSTNYENSILQMHYTNVNLFCDAHGIPYKNRKKLYLREIEMISLHIHDWLPYNHSEQGICAGNTSLSKYYIFFHLLIHSQLHAKNERFYWWWLWIFLEKFYFKWFWRFKWRGLCETRWFISNY